MKKRLYGAQAPSLASFLVATELLMVIFLCVLGGERLVPDLSVASMLQWLFTSCSENANSMCVGAPSITLSITRLVGICSPLTGS